MSERTIEGAMNLTAVLAIERAAHELGISTGDALTRFFESRTAEALYDDSLKYWWDGPAAVCDMFLAEQAG